MSHAHGRFRPVYMLAARSAGAHRLPSHVLSVKAGFVNRLDNVDPDEPVLPFVLRSKWTARGPLYRPAPGGCKRIPHIPARDRNQSGLSGSWFWPRLEFNYSEFEGG